MIDPAFWNDSKIIQLSIPARLLYIGLWNYADDEGFFLDDLPAIKRTLFPDQKFDIHGAFSECSCFLLRHQYKDQEHFAWQISHFCDWQTINRPTASKIKPFCTLIEDSLNTHGGLTLKLREVKLREDKLSNTSHLKPDEPKWPSPYLLIEKYNKLVCDDLPAVEKITPARLKKAKEYLGLFPDETFWLETFQEINQSQFLRGQVSSNNHHSFRANFDWLLTKGKDGTENVVKVFEGRFRDGR